MLQQTIEMPLIMSATLTKIWTTFEKDLNDLFKYLRQFSDYELNKKPSDDAWSVIQIMHHLILSENSGLQYVQRKLSNNNNILKASATSKLRALVLVTSMKQPIHLKAPASVSNENLINSASFREIEVQWRQSRKKLVEFLSQQDDAVMESESFKHPITGKMSIWSMLDFFQAHFYRHEKQIKKTIRLVEEK